MSTSPKLTRSLVLLVTSFLTVAMADVAPWNRAEFEREVMLMEITDGDYGPGNVEILEDQEKRKLTADEKTVFVGVDDGKWKVFEDEFVRFELPDHPLLKVEVVTPEKKERIRIVGGAVGTTDNRFQRAYRMTVNNLPVGVLLLNEADWFDDGICFCGPIVHKTCVFKEGTLLEFSLLPGGRVKKVQALGDKHRAVLFEWTHSVLTAERYQRIGASIRLKQRSDRSLEDWIAIEREQRGNNDLQGVGWLRRGDTEAKVRSLLGTPTQSDRAVWVYKREKWEDNGSGRLISLSLRMNNGTFVGLPSEMWHSEDLPPRRGSTSWAEKLAEKQPQNTKKAGLTEEVLSIYTELKRQAPNSPAWNKWCQIAHELTEKGYRDESLRNVAAGRFLETNIEQHYSAWLLNDYPSNDTEQLYQKRVRKVLDDCRANPKRPLTDPHEIWNLFSFMKIKEQASLDLLREALTHPNETIRSSAYGQSKSLPQDEARAIAKKAIQSEKDEHCLTMATYLIRDVGLEEDIAWLTSQKARFQSEELSKLWSEALDSLRKEKR